MAYSFVIEPGEYVAFEDEAEQIGKCREWGLLSDKAVKTKTFYYKGNGMNITCSLAGYVDDFTAVIRFDNLQEHCIHPSFLKEMQASNYSQRLTAGGDDAGAAPAGVSPAESSDGEGADGGDSAPAPKAAKAPKAAAAPKKAVKEVPAKLQLPEEKVSMTATVQDFTTVPNNFSEQDDEVIIYEAVAILEPRAEVGAAWSSHSNTLKKLDLQVGDTITFEAKIVKKKLTRHPVPYKINNPSKIQKQ